MGVKCNMDHGNMYNPAGTDIGDFETFDQGGILETALPASATWDWDAALGGYVARGSSGSQLFLTCIQQAMDKCVRWSWRMLTEDPHPPHELVQTASGEMGA